MTKEERYAIWNRYYQRHKTEINARRKIVRENYKNKLSKAEKQMAELEGQVTRAFEVLEGKRKKIEELEQENATLKKQLEALSGDIPWNELKDVSEVTKELTEAKDLLNEFMRISKASDEDFEHDYSELIGEAERFLEE